MQNRQARRLAAAPSARAARSTCCICPPDHAARLACPAISCQRSQASPQYSYVYASLPRANHVAGPPMTFKDLLVSQRVDVDPHVLARAIHGYTALVVL